MTLNSLDLVAPDRTFRRDVIAVIKEDGVPTKMSRDRSIGSSFFLRAARDRVRALHVALVQPPSLLRDCGVNLSAQELMMAIIGIPNVIEADPQHDLHQKFQTSLGTLCGECLEMLDRDARLEDAGALNELRGVLRCLHDRFVPQAELELG